MTKLLDQGEQQNGKPGHRHRTPRLLRGSPWRYTLLPPMRLTIYNIRLFLTGIRPDIKFSIRPDSKFSSRISKAEYTRTDLDIKHIFTQSSE